MSTICCPQKTQAVYQPRQPEKTALFDVIKKHYVTRQKNSKDLAPTCIDKEFRNYLECGILAKGFACAHCANLKIS